LKCSTAKQLNNHRFLLRKGLPVFCNYIHLKENELSTIYRNTYKRLFKIFSVEDLSCPEAPPATHRPFP
jgi:hypothetical protein